MDLNKTLDERGKRYGDYAPKAHYMQQLKDGMRCQPSWTSVRGYQRETLDMIMHKIARIVHGDPDYVDSWQDIAGYATLVVKELTSGAQEKTSTKPIFTSSPISAGNLAEVYKSTNRVESSEQLLGSPHGDEEHGGPYSDDYGRISKGIGRDYEIRNGIIYWK